jgi:Tol biopolymer transport system component/DNA-binding winged helix-turn-helix (wHTH) protein
MRATSENCYEFGEFRLDADERQLFRGESALEITPKALDILHLLVINAGRTVTKEEIFQKVWPDSFVEETNLSHHVFRLRKILGETEARKFIETVPRRGYRFVEKTVRVEPAQPDTTVDVAPSRPITNRSKQARIVAPVILLLVFATAAFVIFRARTSQEAQSKNATETEQKTTQSITRITREGKFVASTISPDGKFVAYAQNYSSGEGMLYIRQLETNNERRLLEPADRNFGSISFSPDGTFIYYIAYEPNDPEGSLYRVPVIGGEASKVLGNVKFMFSLSGDGKQAAFYRFENDDKRRSAVVTTLGDTPDERTVATFPTSSVSSVPALSPDGRYLSYSAADLGSDFAQPQYALSVIDLVTGERRQISDEKWLEIGKTVWRADGNGIVFIGNRPRSGYQIYSMAFPSGDVQQITNELNNYGNYGMGITRDGTIIVADLWETQTQLWSIDASGKTAGAEQLTNGSNDGSTGLATLRDGEIIYSTRSGEDRDLWMLKDTDGLREGKPLTADASSETGACVPRDGRFLVFASDRAGSSHLFNMNLESKESKQITSGSEHESSPECSADGSYVLYDAGSRIWKISSDGGDGVPLTDYECVAPSMSPDGKFFSCVQPTGSQIKNATLAIVPIEGGAPVKTFGVIPFGFYYRAVRWTPDGAGLIFRKTDKQIGNLWRQDAAGGEPKRMTDFRSEVIFNYVYSQDGKQLVISRGKFAVNTVLLQNFN